MKKRVRRWLAKNPGKFDFENTSFYKTLSTAKKYWGSDGQEIIPCVIIYELPKKKVRK